MQSCEYISSLEEFQRFIDVAIFKDILNHVFLSSCLVNISIGVLRENQMSYFDPILMQVLDTNLVSPHVVSSESLHTKVINESILLQVLNILQIVKELSSYLLRSAQSWYL